MEKAGVNRPIQLSSLLVGMIFENCFFSNMDLTLQMFVVEVDKSFWLKICMLDLEVKLNIDSKDCHWTVLPFPNPASLVSTKEFPSPMSIQRGLYYSTFVFKRLFLWDSLLNWASKWPVSRLKVQPPKLPYPVSTPRADREKWWQRWARRSDWLCKISCERFPPKSGGFLIFNIDSMSNSGCFFLQWFISYIICVTLSRVIYEPLIPWSPPSLIRKRMSRPKHPLPLIFLQLWFLVRLQEMARQRSVEVVP